MSTRLLDRVSPRRLMPRVIDAEMLSYDPVSIGRNACSAEDHYLRDRALRALNTYGDDDPPSQQLMLLGLIQGSEVRRPGLRSIPIVPAPVTSFLVAPTPECSHDPKVRVVQLLTAPLPCEPSELSHRHVHPWHLPPKRLSRRDVARWLVDAALHATDERVRDDLVDVLRNTNQPYLLNALQYALSYAVKHQRWGFESPYRLWTDERPTVLTEIFLANPCLPLALAPPDARDESGEVPVVVLAILKDRRPPETYGLVLNLLNALRLSGAPADFKDRCRRALRELPPGEAQESICSWALSRDAEVRAAVVDAGYLPREGRLAFLFVTEQWERYDRADPDGRLLRDYLANDKFSAQRPEWCMPREIMLAAARGNRPNPCPPPPPPPRYPAPGGYRGRPGPIGSWPTDPGGYGFGDAGSIGSF